MRPLLAALVLLGCDRRPVQAVADPVADARRDEPTATILPLVSGCGCAYQCARGLRVGADGVWEVTHDLLDSTTVKAVVERRCFDEKGHANPGDCTRVFYDRTPCGGECIPTTQYLRCGAQ